MTQAHVQAWVAFFHSRYPALHILSFACHTFIYSEDDLEKMKQGHALAPSRMRRLKQTQASAFAGVYVCLIVSFFFPLSFFLCLSIHIHIFLSFFIVCLSIYTYVYVHVIPSGEENMYSYVYVYVHVYVYVYIYIVSFFLFYMYKYMYISILSLSFYFMLHVFII